MSESNCNPHPESRIDLDDASRDFVPRLLSDSLILAGVSATIYIGTYVFSTAYLSHYGLSRVFVEISTKSIVFSLLGLATSLLILWQLFQIIPVKIARSAPMFFYYFVVEITLLSLSVFSLISIGFTWFFFGLIGITAAWLAVHIPLLRRNIKKNGGISVLYSGDLKSELAVQSIFLAGNILDRIGQQVFRAVFYTGIYIITSWIGGKYYATRAQEFQIVEAGSDLFAVVSEKDGNFIAVGVIPSSDSIYTYNLQGKVKVFAPNSEDISFADLKYVRLVQPQPVPTSKWITFQDFWKKNFGNGQP